MILKLFFPKSSYYYISKQSVKQYLARYAYYFHITLYPYFRGYMFSLQYYIEEDQSVDFNFVYIYVSRKKLIFYPLIFAYC